MADQEDQILHYLITGGTGFIGRALIQTLSAQNARITILSRQHKTHPLHSQCNVIQTLSALPTETRLDCIINLAGSPIDRRWTPKVKRILLESRIHTTQAIIQLVGRLTHKPKLMISASAIGYYGNYHNETLTEESTPKTPSFTHHLCSQWEKTAQEARHYGVRVCLARLGVVLGSEGGFIQKTYAPFKLGLGGCLGSGTQGFSWIHIEDVIHGFLHLMHTPSLNGPYNFVAPHALSNAQLTAAIGHVLKRPVIFNIPTPLVRLLFGEMGENLLLKGNTIVPQRLMASGYPFQYTAITHALAQIYAEI